MSLRNHQPNILFKNEFSASFKGKFNVFKKYFWAYEKPPYRNRRPCHDISPSWSWSAVCYLKRSMRSSRMQKWLLISSFIKKLLLIYITKTSQSLPFLWGNAILLCGFCATFYLVMGVFALRVNERIFRLSTRSDLLLIINYTTLFIKR